jgi:poly-gamma-glutamate synthesis protein (capsule biosynthesis protein)
LGKNWGFDIPDEHSRFAHEVIDKAGVSIVHGHSSHHPMAMEIYRNRLILYGCGDFLNDYEGISGCAEFLDDLTLMYFASVDLRSGDLLGLDMIPLQIRRCQLGQATSEDTGRHWKTLEDTDWLLKTPDHQCRTLGTRVTQKADGRLALSWPHDQAEPRVESALHER